MKGVKSDWYKNIWSLDIKNMSWVEETDRQVNFLIKEMTLNGSERILDMACGFGRHSLAFAKKGFHVVGVDITPAFIEDAAKTARQENLPVDFICADIRDIGFKDAFEVVINMADGAIGYLEDDRENLKIFDKISEALKPGGKHFMDICSREHAERYFPKRHWEIGGKSVSLADFSWDAEKKRMLYGGWNIPFGETAEPPASKTPHSSTRLYNRDELESILAERGMTMLTTYSDYNGTPDAYTRIQFMAYSRKLPL